MDDCDAQDKLINKILRFVKAEEQRKMGKEVKKKMEKPFITHNDSYFCSNLNKKKKKLHLKRTNKNFQAAKKRRKIQDLILYQQLILKNKLIKQVNMLKTNS